MKNMIGLIRHDNKPILQDEQEHLNIEPGKHVLIVGSTGSGKTTLLKELIRRKVNSGESVVLIDEKDTLHYEMKHIFQEEHPVYQLSPGGNGAKNNVQINLLDLVCTSEKKAQQFFRDIISDDYEKNESGHKFWALAGAELAYKIYRYVRVMNSLLQILEVHEEKNGKVIMLKRTFELEYQKKTTYIDFCLSSAPLTFKTLRRYLTDFDQFRALTEKGNELVSQLEFRLKRNIIVSALSEEKVRKLDSSLNDLRIASEELSRAKVNPNPGEASGMNGVFMTMKSSLPESVFENEILNRPYPTHNIFELLEGGKMSTLLIINGMDKDSKKILFNMMSEHFSMRSHQNHISPVSFILEELPRYASPTLDYERTLAYARQSLYSIIGVIQDYSQLNKFSSDEVDSILNNVTLFQLSTKREALEKFHYIHNGEIYRFEPEFISKEALYRTELKYQKDTGQYSEVKRNENEIVIYDERLYGMRNVVTVVNIDTMEEREVIYEPEAERMSSGYFLERYYEDHEPVKDADEEFNEFIHDFYEDSFDEDDYIVHPDENNY